MTRVRMQTEADCPPELPLDATMPQATVSLYTDTQLREVSGTHFLSAKMEMGGEGSSTPWVTIETNYMTSRPDGSLAEHKEDIEFPFELIPQLRQMLESLEVRAAALSRVVAELEAPVPAAVEGHTAQVVPLHQRVPR